MKLLLTIREAAPFFGLSERRLYALIAQGELPPDLVVHFGRAVRLSRPRLLRWLGVTEDGTVAGDGAIE